MAAINVTNPRNGARLLNTPLKFDWWIVLGPIAIFLYFFVKKAMRMAIKNGLIDQKNFGYFCLLLVVILVTDIFLHENCHKLFFEILTGRRAYIKWLSIRPTCHHTGHCLARAYRVCGIAPIISTALIGVIFAIVLLLQAPSWTSISFALGIVISFLGLTDDIYWFFLFAGVPRTYHIYDHDSYIIAKDIRY